MESAVIEVNYLAVLGAAIGAVILGALWYGPVFGKAWLSLIGMTKEEMKAMPLSPLVAMLGGVLVSLLMAYVLSHLITFASAYMNTPLLYTGLSTAFWVWLGFAVPLTSGGFLWEGKPLSLWILNAGYYLASLLIMGSILGAFPA